MRFASREAYQKINTLCFRQGGHPGFDLGLAGLVGYRAGFRRHRDELLIDLQEIDKSIEWRCQGLEMRRHWWFKPVLILLKFGCECGGFQPSQVQDTKISTQDVLTHRDESGEPSLAFNPRSPVFLI